MVVQYSHIYKTDPSLNLSENSKELARGVYRIQFNKESF